MTDRIDIREPTAEICRRIGLDPSNVAELHWTPSELKAVVFLVNETGHKYLVDEAGVAAKEERVFEVRA